MQLPVLCPHQLSVLQYSISSPLDCPVLCRSFRSYTLSPPRDTSLSSMSFCLHRFRSRLNRLIHTMCQASFVDLRSLLPLQAQRGHHPSFHRLILAIVALSTCPGPCRCHADTYASFLLLSCQYLPSQDQIRSSELTHLPSTKILLRCLHDLQSHDDHLVATSDNPC